MSRTLAYQRATDRRAAAGTWLPGLLVSHEVILKLTTSIDPIDAGAVAADAFEQHLANRA